MTGEKYLAAAYLVVFVALLAYVMIIALKLGRLQRDLGELEALTKTPAEAEKPTRLPVATDDDAAEAPTQAPNAAGR